MSRFLINTVVNYLWSPQGPARLYGYLRRAGMDVTCLNTNHDTYSYLFSRENLDRTLATIRSSFATSLGRNRPFRQALGGILMASSCGEIRTQIEALLEPAPKPSRPAPDERFLDRLPFALLDCAPLLAERIAAAQRRMDETFLRRSPEEFLADLRVLLCGKAIIDAAHFPAQIDAGLGFQGMEWNPVAADVMRAATDEKHNFLLPYYRAEILPTLEKAGARIVGLSISHLSELVPVFTLAAAIKSRMPEAHVVLGGTVVQMTRDRIANNAALWDCCDSLVYGPGEIPFLELVQALEGGRPLSTVPNVIYKDGDHRRYSDRTVEMDPDDCATPEYVGLRPGSVVGLETTVSCYWGRCAFCYYPQLAGSSRDYQPVRARERSLDKVLEDLTTLARNHRPAMVCLTDSSTSPARLAAIARHNRESGLDLPFSGFIRLEEEFASPGLCSELARGGFLGGQAGLESGCERVNRLINKGTNHARLPEILRTLHESGILVQLYTVIGFPGETEEEAFQTCEFLERNREHLPADWGVSGLYVAERGPLATDPDRFGLKLFPLPDPMLIPACGYETTGSLTGDQVGRIVRQVEERLAPLRHPLSAWMDPELCKTWLLVEHARRFIGRPRGGSAGGTAAGRPPAAA